jgi:hypothetical protein
MEGRHESGGVLVTIKYDNIGIYDEPGYTYDGDYVGSADKKRVRKAKHEARMQWPRDDRKTRGKVVH